MAIRLDGAEVLQVDLVCHKGEARLLLLPAQHLPEHSGVRIRIKLDSGIRSPKFLNAWQMDPDPWKYPPGPQPWEIQRTFHFIKADFLYGIVSDIFNS